MYVRRRGAVRARARGGALDPGVRFHDFNFDGGFLGGRRDAGAEVTFTRQERKLLALISPHPGRLFSRDELWDVIGSGGSDRAVDYVINRLRAKLEDSAQDPCFIQTRYGEGYVWLPRPSASPTSRPFLVLEAVRGGEDSSVQTLVGELQAALQSRLGAHRPVLAPRPISPGGAADADFSLQVSAHRVGEAFHAGLVLRSSEGRQSLGVFRESLSAPTAAGAVHALADAVLEAAWRHVAIGSSPIASPTDPPLHLRLHAASVLLDPPGAPWVSNSAHIARLRSESPEDPRLAVLWAMHLYGQIMVAPGPDTIDASAIEALADEIEGLVLRNLAEVRQDPVFALAAAKLLVGVHRGHEDLAEQLARAALEGSAAFAAAFPMLGQITASRGDLPEALRLYDEGLFLCEPGSMFEVYIQVLKATALIAADDRAGVEVVYRRLAAISRPQLERFALFFLPAGDDGLAQELGRLADRVDPGFARRSLAYLHYRIARYFQTPEHAANIMRGPMVHLIRRFGRKVVPEQIWAELPTELHHLRRASIEQDRRPV